MNRSEKIVSIVLFFFVFIIYAYCVPSTISFWDSPEFITTNNNLQISHPPGAPLYTILCSFILLFFSSSKAALVSNLISSFFGACTVSLVFHISYFLSRKLTGINNKENSNFVPLFSGIISALSLAFCTSFWIASTEAEVYTLSFFFLCLLFYIALRWETTECKKNEFKLQLLFVLILGLSVGVHLIILSAIIPFSLLFTKKKYGFNFKKAIITLIASTGLFFFIYSFLIQGLIKLSGRLDFILVNALGLFLNSGVILVIILIMCVIGGVLFFSHKRKKIVLHHMVLAILFFLIGISSYIMPLLRSDAGSLVTNGTFNSQRLLDYVQGNQFGISNIPLVKGYSYNAPLYINKPFSDIPPVYSYDFSTKRYELTHDGLYKVVNHPPEFSMLFPRLYDTNSSDLYRAWTPIKGERINYRVKGERQAIYKPTFTENLKFFAHYQVYWLNLRYLFWNFIGKQNNDHGLGYVENGNWISGFNVIDKHIIGDIDKIPEYYQNNESKDVYYFIPFLLGLLGLLALWKNKPYFWVSVLTFLAFGIGITIYINPPPTSLLVRERDYIFIGSFIVFAIWIGVSMNFLSYLLQKHLKTNMSRTIIGVFLMLIGPFQLMAKGWDNHQRKDNDYPYKLAKSYLDSCPEQSILITNGDNFSFPIWYLQYVENYRPDVRVINYDQLNLDHTINKLSKQSLDSKPIKLNLKEGLYNYGVDKLVPFNEDTKEIVDLSMLFNFLNSDETRMDWNGQKKNYVPSQSFSFTIPLSKKQKDSLSARKYYSTSSRNKLLWDFKKDFYGLNDLVVLNIIQNNFAERKIMFLDNGKNNHNVGLERYFIKKGLVHELSGITRNNPKMNPKIIDTDVSYKILVEESEFKDLGSKVFNNYENKLISGSILRQNYYFLAQALFEEGKIKKALKTLEICKNSFPDNSIPYKQYAFAIGKLYIRMGYKSEGVKICETAIQNIWKELKWITSFDPQNPIINVRHAEKKYQIFIQMLNEANRVKLNPISKEELTTFTQNFTAWKKANWPY